MSPRATASALQRIKVCSIAIASPRYAAKSDEALAMFRVRNVAETGSTNDDAASLLGEAGAPGLVIVADYQSAGRGRRARNWVAPRGSALLFTAILPEP